MRARARTRASIKYGVSVEVYIRVEVKCKEFDNGDNKPSKKVERMCDEQRLESKKKHK